MFFFQRKNATDTAIKANLGDKNTFYYNEELSRWVERGKESLVEAHEAPNKPPPRPATSAPRTAANLPGRGRGARTLYANTPGITTAPSFSTSCIESPPRGYYSAMLDAAVTEDVIFDPLLCLTGRLMESPSCNADEALVASQEEPPTTEQPNMQSSAQSVHSYCEQSADTFVPEALINNANNTSEESKIIPVDNSDRLDTAKCPHYQLLETPPEVADSAQPVMMNNAEETDQVSLLRQEIKDLHSELQRLSENERATVEQHKRELETERSQRFDAERKISELEEEKLITENRVANRERELQSLLEVHQAEAKLDLQKALDRQAAEFSAKQQIDERNWRGEIDNLTVVAIGCKGRLQSVTEATTALSERFGDIVPKADAALKSFNSMLQVLKEKEAQLEASSKTMEMLVQCVEKLVSAKQFYLNQWRCASKEINRLQSVEESKTELEGYLQQMQESLRVKELANEELQKSSDERISILNDQIASVQSRCILLETEEQRLKEEVQRLTENLQATEEECEDLKKHNADIQLSMSELQQNLTLSDSSRQKLEDNTTTLELEIQTLKNEVAREIEMRFQTEGGAFEELEKERAKCMELDSRLTEETELRQNVSEQKYQLEAECETLKAENAALVTAVQQSSEEVLQLKDRVGYLTKEVEDLNGRCRDYEVSLTDAEKSAVLVKEEFTNRLCEATEKASAAEAYLENVIQDAGEKIAAWSNAYNELSAFRTDAVAKLVCVTKENESLRASNLQIQEQSAETIDKLEERIENLFTENDHFARRLESEKGFIKKVNDLENELEETKRQLADALISAEEASEAMRDQFEDQQRKDLEEVETLTLSLKNKDAEIIECKKDIERLKAAHTVALDSLNSGHQSELSELQQRHSETSQDLQREVYKLRNFNQELQHNLEVLQHEATDVNALEITVQQLTDDLSEKSAAIANLQSKIITLERFKLEASKYREAMETSMIGIREHCANLTQTIEELEAPLLKSKGVEAENARLRKQIEGLRGTKSLAHGNHTMSSKEELWTNDGQDCRDMF